MQIKTVSRVGAITSALALLTLAGSPALAAAPVAQASATGLVLTIAAQSQQSGMYSATNDGTRETTTGSNQPALGALGNQTFLSAGTLAQDAKTAVASGEGSSAACSGLAGQGASVASAGGPGSCLTGGNALDLNPTQIDINKILNVTLVSGQNSSLAGLLAAIPGASAQIQPITDALQAQINTLTGQLAGSAVVISAGAIQSSCTASIGRADGTANIADAGAFIQIPNAFPVPGGNRINLLNFPASPPPNTKLVVNLDTVLNTLIDALKTSFDATAQGALAPILGQINDPVVKAALTAIQQQIINTAVAQVASQLTPVQTNVLDVTLNKQTRAAADQISVTALDIDVLPAVASQLGGRALGAEIGTSNCGPSGRVQAVAPAAASATPTPKAPKNNPKPDPEPKVPTSVPAGLADAPSRNAPLGPWALAGMGALLAASVGAGTVSYRRSSSRP